MFEIPKILDQIQDYDHMSSLEKWVYFLRYGNKVDDSVIQKLSVEPVFKKALEVVKMVNNDQRIKDAAFARKRHELDLNQSRYEGKQEGRLEGHAEGVQNVMTIMQMLKKGLNPELIQKETGMELEKIFEIQKLMQ